MEELSIGEVARRTGVAASALRYYEDAGLRQRKRAILAGMECGCVRMEDCLLVQPAQS